MTATVQPGDVVYAYRGHCKRHEHLSLGRTWVVLDVKAEGHRARCPVCLEWFSTGAFIQVGRTTGYPLAWVRKFQPLSEAETREARREMVTER